MSLISTSYKLVDFPDEIQLKFCSSLESNDLISLSETSKRYYYLINGEPALVGKMKKPIFIFKKLILMTNCQRSEKLEKNSIHQKNADVSREIRLALKAINSIPEETPIAKSKSLLYLAKAEEKRGSNSALDFFISAFETSKEVKKENARYHIQRKIVKTLSLSHPKKARELAAHFPTSQYINKIKNPRVRAKKFFMLAENKLAEGDRKGAIKLLLKAAENVKMVEQINLNFDKMEFKSFQTGYHNIDTDLLKDITLNLIELNVVQAFENLDLLLLELMKEVLQARSKYRSCQLAPPFCSITEYNATLVEIIEKLVYFDIDKAIEVATINNLELLFRGCYKLDLTPKQLFDRLILIAEADIENSLKRWDILQQVVKYSEQISNLRDRVYAFTRIARLHLKNDNRQRARRFLQKAIKDAEKCDESYQQQLCYCEIAVTLAEIDQDEAEKIAQKIVNAFTPNDPYDVYHPLENYCEIGIMLNRKFPDHSIDILKFAVTHLEQWSHFFEIIFNYYIKHGLAIDFDRDHKKTREFLKQAIKFAQDNYDTSLLSDIAQLIEAPRMITAGLLQKAFEIDNHPFYLIELAKLLPEHATDILEMAIDIVWLEMASESIGIKGIGIGKDSGFYLNKITKVLLTEKDDSSCKKFLKKHLFYYPQITSKFGFQPHFFYFW